jgi:ESS family glutamate:Na+ symporter
MPALAIELSTLQTLALAGVVLFLGYGICRLVPQLARWNIPAPVVGGLIVAVGVMVGRHQFGPDFVKFDTALQEPLMIAFFTSIGFGASLALLRRGGPDVGRFLGISTAGALLQNVAGIGVALAFGLSPLFGVLCGSVALTGGPGTALAFAKEFEAAGISGAATVGLAAAMGGIVTGGLLGGPIATLVIERFRLRTPGTAAAIPDSAELTAANLVEARMPEPATVTPAGEDVEAHVLLKNLVAILVAMVAGAWISGQFMALNLTLPPYIGAMLAAAVLRNLDDVSGIMGLSQRTIDDLGTVSLSLFLALALMTLDLSKLAGLAVPLLVILAVQLALVVVLCAWAIFPLMGRDYESAVVAGGFAGFMLGTTANAMANMRALVERYGPAPRAFLIVPMVGAFFIDFINSMMITSCLNIWK